MVITELNKHVEANLFLCLIMHTHGKVEATPRIAFDTR